MKRNDIVLAIAVCTMKHSQLSAKLIMTTNGNTIKLDQFLKLLGIAETGGHAKLMIQGGEVKVNGTIETRRGRQLVEGDRVMVEGQTFSVNLGDS